MQYSKTNRNHPVKHETEVVCAIQNYTRQGHLHLLFVRMGLARETKKPYQPIAFHIHRAH